MSQLQIAVIGAGTMGHGIAQVCAVAGHSVRLVDANPDVLEQAQVKINQSLDKLVSKEKLSEARARLARSNIQPTEALSAATASAGLVLEAVPERLELKQALLKQAAKHANPDAVLATNTSSLSIGSIAEGLPKPERVIGLHFFNPVPLMALLEIVHAEMTSSQTIEFAQNFARGLGKEPIVVRDVPGFASSRLGVILGAEAIRMLETGVASAEDIDKAMVLGYRHPMGPLRLTDLVGLDVRLAILEHLSKEIGPQFEPPALLRKMVAEGKLGRKSGQGFYSYE